MATCIQVGDVYDSLHKKILLLELLPGQLISENDLCQEYSTSRTTIRRALQKLQNEHLVDIYPQKGSFVSRLSIKHWKDVLYIRFQVESNVLVLLCELYSPDIDAELRASLKKQLAILEEKPFDAFAFFAEDNAFHRACYRAVGQEGCWEIIDSHMSDSIRCRMLGYLVTGSLYNVYEEHLEIVRCLATGEKEEVVRKLRHHLIGYSPRTFGLKMPDLNQFFCDIE